MAVRIQSADKMVGKGGIKVAIHSAAGMGKTMLAATAPKPIVILTERSGADSLSKRNIEKVFAGQKGITTYIPIIEAFTIPEMEEAIQIAREDDRFETIFFDSVSEMSKLKLKTELPLHKNKLQAYGAMAEHVDDLIRAMRDDDKNWVWLFHSEPVDIYDDDGEPASTVMVPGFEGRKMNTEFPHLVGDVWCVVNEFDDEGNEMRRLRTRQGDTAQYAKNRRGLLDELEPMHLGKLFRKLKSK